MLTPADRSPRPPGELLDADAVAATLEQLVESHAGREHDLRQAVAQRLKAALAAGRTKAEELLLKDRGGRRCAERLCFMQDEIIRIVFEFAERHLYPVQN